MSRDTDAIFGYHATASEKRQASDDWYGDFTPSSEDMLYWDMQQRFLELRAAGKSVDEAEAIVDEEFGNDEGGETDDDDDAGASRDAQPAAG
jgi:hypothetical protein